MGETAIQIRAEGTAEIYRGGRQYLRTSGDDSEHRWLKRDSNGLRPVSKSRERRLERIYRHRETAKAIRRCPRLEWERKAGQPVFSPAFGFGKIVAIIGSKIVVKFGKSERVVGAQDLMTRAQVEADWHLYWLRGERRRLEEGRRLSIIKSLCQHGEWQAFLDKYDYPRSTADDLIRRYHDEVKWETRTQLTGYRSIEHGDPEQPLNERVPDRDNTELAKLVRKEADERRGKEPSHNNAFWTLRIVAPPEILEMCRRRYKRKPEKSKEFWTLAAYVFIGKDRPHKKHHKSHRSHD